MNLVFMGPPGSGKSTIAKKLVEERGVKHFSTGDIIREKLKDDAEFKKEFEELISKGKLLSDEKTKQLLIEKMQKSDISNGFILDGYPRTEKQISDLEQIMQTTEKKIDAVIYFSLPEQAAVDRLSKRQQCPECQRVYNLASAKPAVEGICDNCGSQLTARADDEAETIRTRFREYKEKTRPVAEHYQQKGLLHEINVHDTVENNWKKMQELIKKLNL